MSPSRRFLIVGCQRSGTTAIAAALARHREITVWDEADSYRVLSESGATKSGVEGFKIPRWTDLLPSPAGGDPDQPELATEYEYQGELLILPIRNPIDVVASMDSLQLGDSSWLDLYGVPLLEWRIRTGLEIAAPAREVLRDLDPDMYRWGCAALYWVSKSLPFDRWQKMGWPLVAMRYEDLVSEPAEHLGKVITAMQLDWSDAVLSSSVSLQDPAGGTDPGRPLDKRSIGRGASLPEDVQALVAEITGPLYERLCEEVAVR